MEGRLPDFICIGVQKAGTTTLHDLLSLHPDFFLPEQKELHFFDRNYEKGIEWYKSNFVTDKRLVGEITPSYAYTPGCARSIFDMLGAIKIILILRDPVERAYSHYLMSVRRGYETLGFVEAVNREGERIGENDFGNNHFSYIARSRYASQILEYKAYFKDNLYICDFDDLKENNELFLNQLMAFLGAAPLSGFCHDIRSNPAREFKSRRLKRLMTGDNPLRKTIRRILGSRVSAALKQKILEHGLDTATVARLSDADRQYVRTTFFQEEISDTESLSGRRFPRWRE
jgi:hypothetical protein